MIAPGDAPRRTAPRSRRCLGAEGPVLRGVEQRAAARGQGGRGAARFAPLMRRPRRRRDSSARSRRWPIGPTGIACLTRGEHGRGRAALRPRGRGLPQPRPARHAAQTQVPKIMALSMLGQYDTRHRLRRAGAARVRRAGRRCAAAAQGQPEPRRPARAARRLCPGRAALARSRGAVRARRRPRALGDGRHRPGQRADLARATSTRRCAFSRARDARRHARLSGARKRWSKSRWRCCTRARPLPRSARRLRGSAPTLRATRHAAAPGDRGKAARRCLPRIAPAARSARAVRPGAGAPPGAGHARRTGLDAGAARPCAGAAGAQRTGAADSSTGPPRCSPSKATASAKPPSRWPAPNWPSSRATPAHATELAARAARFRRCAARRRPGPGRCRARLCTAARRQRRTGARPVRQHAGRRPAPCNCWRCRCAVCRPGPGGVGAGSAQPRAARSPRAVELFEDQRRALPGDDLRSAFLASTCSRTRSCCAWRLHDARAAPSPASAPAVLAQLERVRARSLGERIDDRGR